jgi:hypothetical protein
VQRDDPNLGVDLEAGTLSCPAGTVTVIGTGKDGSGRADFAGGDR